MKTILHIDMDCYFCSVELILNPTLKNKPIAVGGLTKRSVVASANYEARKYGVMAAEPIFHAVKKCPNLIVLKPHFEQYEYYHNEFIKLLKTYFCKKIEVASIDECYLDITKLVKNNSPEYIALKIQTLIKSKLNLPCSIGISNNKFLAKMGSKMKKPFGISTLYPNEIPTKLWHLNIEKMHMVGSKTAFFLRKNNINTIGDLAKTNKDFLKEIFGKNWEYYYKCSNGISDDNVITVPPIPKSFSESQTFLNNTNNYDEIIEVLVNQSKNIWKQYKTSNLNFKTISVFIKYPNNTQTIKSKKFKNIEDYEFFICELKKLYENNFEEKIIKLIGCRLSN